MGSFSERKKIVYNISQVGFVGKSKPPVTPGVFYFTAEKVAEAISSLRIEY